MIAPGCGSLSELSAVCSAEIRCVQLIDRRTSQKGESEIEIVLQDLDCASNTGLSRGGKSIGVSPPDQHSASTEANRLSDIAAPAHPAVHQDFDLATDRLHNLGQRIERSRDAV